jgi:hypothetical protein
MYEPLVGGVNAYQTDHWGENPHDGLGSPGWTLAPVVSRSCPNGTDEIGVAFAKSSFAGGGIACAVRLSVPELQL